MTFDLCEYEAHIWAQINLVYQSWYSSCEKHVVYTLKCQLNKNFTDEKPTWSSRFNLHINQFIMGETQEFFFMCENSQVRLTKQKKAPPSRKWNNPNLNFENVTLKPVSSVCHIFKFNLFPIHESGQAKENRASMMTYHAVHCYAWLSTSLNIQIFDFSVHICTKKNYYISFRPDFLLFSLICQARAIELMGLSKKRKKTMVSISCHIPPSPVCFFLLPCYYRNKCSFREGE